MSKHTTYDSQSFWMSGKRGLTVEINNQDIMTCLSRFQASFFPITWVKPRLWNTVNEWDHMLHMTSWSREQFGWYTCGFWNLENGPLYCLLYRIFMHQSMFSPRGERSGIQYPRYSTQCLLLWLGNRKRFDKTQNPKGGDIWQSCKRAWKLQSSTPPPPPCPWPNVEQNALILMAWSGSVPSVL